MVSMGGDQVSSGAGCFSKGCPLSPALLTSQEDLPQNMSNWECRYERQWVGERVCRSEHRMGGEERQGARKGGSIYRREQTLGNQSF